jgi:hypothetical protein
LAVAPSPVLPRSPLFSHPSALTPPLYVPHGTPTRVQRTHAPSASFSRPTKNQLQIQILPRDHPKGPPHSPHAPTHEPRDCNCTILANVCATLTRARATHALSLHCMSTMFLNCKPSNPYKRGPPTARSPPTGRVGIPYSPTCVLLCRASVSRSFIACTAPTIFEFTSPPPTLQRAVSPTKLRTGTLEIQGNFDESCIVP